MVRVCYSATLIALAGIVLLSSEGAAIDIAADGTWSPTTTASDLTAGAGSELVSTYESTAGLLTIGISNTTGSGDGWRVDVRRSDINWPAGVTLSVQRTDDGAGSGTISGGAGYQAVTTSDAEFFSGSGDRTDVDIQLKISSVSLSVPPDTYSTSVVYTVVDTL